MRRELIGQSSGSIRSIPRSRTAFWIGTRTRADVRSDNKALARSKSVTFAGLGAEWRAMPPAVGFPQKKVFECELRLAKREAVQCTLGTLSEV